MEEVAAMMAISLSTAKRLVNRATAIVAECVGRDEDSSTLFSGPDPGGQVMGEERPSDLAIRLAESVGRVASASAAIPLGPQAEQSSFESLEERVVSRRRRVRQAARDGGAGGAVPRGRGRHLAEHAAPRNT